MNIEELESLEKLLNESIKGKVWLLKSWDSEAENEGVQGIFSSGRKAMEYVGIKREQWTVYRKYTTTLKYNDPCGYRGYSISMEDLDPAPE